MVVVLDVYFLLCGALVLNCLDSIYRHIFPCYSNNPTYNGDHTLLVYWLLLDCRRDLWFYLTVLYTLLTLQLIFYCPPNCSLAFTCPNKWIARTCVILQECIQAHVQPDIILARNAHLS
ncbi:hypothetical protein PLICRDRAFT_578559 [Plicaturopsis crispa FD-325 SS-3]|nr:hypothetical protein PLICRDRAFT_578559 [Plicaturopsis crispa FD-325 SS-3]